MLNAQCPMPNAQWGLGARTQCSMPDAQPGLGIGDSGTWDSRMWCPSSGWLGLGGYLSTGNGLTGSPVHHCRSAVRLKMAKCRCGASGEALPVEPT